MKRLLLSGLLALGLNLLLDATATAGAPPGIGANQCKYIGRIRGYWLQPTTGPLYDYSAYFANLYPQIPGAAEYMWRPNQPGAAAYQSGVNGAVTSRRFR
jgi:hypothetical protein